MIDFGKLAGKKAASAFTTHIELFDQLDRKATHQILRPVQYEALASLDAQVKNRDVVLKVSTGSGKTLVGLVYAEMNRRAHPGEPVIYLCPTLQLVDQVLDTADKIGVVAEKFPTDGMPHQAFEGKAVLVCTYDRMFTVRNAFERENVTPSAVVLDDVHSGIDRVRQKYTVQIPGEAYHQIRAIFHPICEPCDPAIWRGIVNNDATARFEVPFWLWQPQCAAVAQILENYREDQEMRFCWANISRYMEDARLCISGASAEISLFVPATEENRAFSGAKHRLFMSASIKDGTSLIRDMGCDPSALDRVVEPASDKGAGERMILPVALIDPKLRKEHVANVCKWASDYTNVVVLTSAGASSAIWEGAGAIARQGADVDVAVTKLRNTSKGNFFVFAQRFDGVDLPDAACRVLVVDGTPTGDRLCDQIDSERQKYSPANNVRVVNRLEQALGRAVRSGADFAAILLVGSDIASFIGRRDVKLLLESHTREQIDLGKDIAEQLRDADGESSTALANALVALLKRDEQWKETHRERVSSVTRTQREAGLTVGERASLAERQAWIFAKARNHQGAVSILQKTLDEVELHSVQRAELMFRMAGYMYHFDQARASNLYRSAFQLNSFLPRPPQMPDRKYAQIRVQAVALSESLHAFSSANAVIAKLEEIRARLAYAGKAESVEQGLCDLGELLGAASSRPEKETGRGPDVLWIFDDIAFCIEAKSEKTAVIFKADAEQLLMSVEWCVEQAGIARDTVVPIFATNSQAADRIEDVSFGPSLLTEDAVMGLVTSLGGLLTGVSFDGPLFRDVSKINQRLHEVRLTGKEIARRLAKLNS